MIGGGCLGFDEPAGAVAVPLPHGSRPVDDGEAIEIAGGPTVRVGDALVGGGGCLDLRSAEDAVAAEWPGSPDACRSASSLAVIDDVEPDGS